MKRSSQSLVMRACPRCGGAAYLEELDGQEWRCLQCARPVPASLVEERRRRRASAAA
ncbi:hypothetical protein D3C83_170670 [compost metagenome]